MISRDFVSTVTNESHSYGLRNDGLLSAVGAYETPDLLFQLGAYHQANSLHFSNVNVAVQGTLSFSTLQQATALHFLVTAGSAPTPVEFSVQVNFTDNSSQTVTGLTAHDWYSPPIGSFGFANSLGRVNYDTDSLDYELRRPILYDVPVPLDAEHHYKTVKSVQITREASPTGVLTVFAVTAKKTSVSIVPSAEGIVYVNKNVVGGSHSGDSWANAIPQLADALKWVKEKHDAGEGWMEKKALKIYVANGVYRPLHRIAAGNNLTSRDQTFLVVPSVELYGGFKGTDMNERLEDRVLPTLSSMYPGLGNLPKEERSILSGDLNGDDEADFQNNAENAYHVTTFVSGQRKSILDGFTITGGNANGTGGVRIGMYEVERSSGGGIHNELDSLSLRNISIYGNKASGKGGGVYNVRVRSVFTDVSIFGNTATAGGGMYIENSQSPHLINVVVSGNSAENGGGVFSYSSQPVIANVIISGNKATSAGGGIYNENESYPVLTNVTITANEASTGGAIFSYYNRFTTYKFQIRNSIIYGNSSGMSYSNSTSAEIRYTLYQEAIDTVGTGNIRGANPANDPQFVNPLPFGLNTGGDYRLKATSPIVNKGNNEYYAGGIYNPLFSINTDLAGNPRIYETTVDMGAFESQGFSFVPNGGILYVNKNISGGTGSGDSWDNAISELAYALRWAGKKAWANHNPLKIYVANGTYKPLYKGTTVTGNVVDATNWENTFLMVPNVQLYGGFTGTDMGEGLDDRVLPVVDLDDPSLADLPLEKRTILSGDLIGDDGDEFIRSDENAYHVVISAGSVANASVDGFTITGGNTATNGNIVIINNNRISNNYGGGVYNASSSLALKNVIVSGNRAEASGGGIYSEGNSSSKPVLTNVVISGNNAKDGGGLYNRSSTILLTNVVIARNTATTNGGGLYNTSSSFPVLTNVTIAENKGNSGGGIYISSSSFPVLRNVRIIGNSSTSIGGGIFNSSSSSFLTNVVISGNTAATNGGGIYNSSSSSPVLTNVIIAGNKGEKGGGMYNYDAIPEIRNSIIYNNSSGIYNYNYNGNNIPVPVISYSLVQELEGEDNGNMDGTLAAHDPQFIQALAPDLNSGGDYRLKRTSPVISRGNNGYFEPESIPDLSDVMFDLDGNLRIQGDRVDLGAYESDMDNIKEVSVLEGIEVDYLTEYSDISILPSQVEVHLFSNTTPVMVDVVWEKGGYNEALADEYVLDGELQLPFDALFTNVDSLKATILITVKKGVSEITALDVQEHIYDGTLKEVLAVLNHEEAIIEYSPEKGYTDVGDYEIEVSIAETPNYLPAMKTIVLKIEPATLTGFILDDERVVYDGNEHPLTVKGLDQGETIRYSNNDQINAGDHTVTATVSKVNYHDLALKAILTIARAESIITTDAVQTHVYDGGLIEVLASLNHGEASLVYSPDQSYTNVGEYTVQVSALQTDNYEAVSETISLEITPAVITGLVFEDKNVVYNGMIHPLEVTGLLAGATVRYSGNEETEAGDHIVTATVSKVNYQDTVLTATLSIEKAKAIVITDAVQTHVYDGAVKEVFASLNHGETSLVYSPEKGYMNVGEYSVQVSASETDNYEAVSETIVLEITPAVMTGLVLEDKNVVYDGKVHPLEVTGLLAGSSITYSGNEETEAGDHIVTATVSKVNYRDVVLTATLSIEKAKAIITIGAVQTHVYDGTVKEVFASLNHDETTIVYSPVKGYMNVGEYSVQVSASETDNYEAVSEAIRLEITPAVMTGLVLEDKNVVYDGKVHSLEVTGLSQGATVTYSSNEETEAGDYIVTATVSKLNYQDAVLTATLSIAKAKAIITTDAVQAHVYDGTVKEVFATLNHGETSLVYAHVKGYTNVGGYSVQVSASETDNYEAVSEAIRLEITPAIISGLVFDDAQVVFDGSVHALQVRNLPEGASVTYVGNEQIQTGIYEVTATVRQTNHQDVVLKAALMIGKAKAIITVNSVQSHVYDGTVKEVFATLNHGETALVYTPKKGYTNVGVYTIQISAPATDNYEAVVKAVVLKISATAISGLVFDDAHVVFDASVHSLKVGNLPEGATVTYSGNDKIQAGIYEVTATISQTNHQDVVLKAALTIAKGKAIITANAVQYHVYDGTSKEVFATLNHTESALVYSPQKWYRDVGEYTISVSAPATANYEAVLVPVLLSIGTTVISDLVFEGAHVVFDGNVHSLNVRNLPQGAAVSYSGNDQVQAGEYVVTATIRQANHQDVALKAQLTIAKAKAVITADAVQYHVYDGTSKVVFATLNHTESVLVYSPQNGYRDVGEYTISVSAPATANYEAVLVPVLLSIGTTVISDLVFEDAHVVFDGNVHSLNVRNLPKGAAVSYSGNDQVQAGEYAVTATIRQGDHQDVVLKAQLTIVKAQAIITADAVQTYVYDGIVKHVQATLNHTESKLSYDPQEGYTDAGVYTVQLSAPETDNYLAVNKEVQLMINQVDLSGVVFKGKSVSYTGQAHQLEVENLPQGWTVDYEGNNQTDAGSYSVTARVNYPGYPEKILTANLIISKARQEISFQEVGTVARDANRVALQVSSSSDLPVRLVSDDSFVATVEGQDLLIHRLGTARITASQGGDKNHEEAEPVSITVVVADEEEGPVKVSKVISPNGDGINDVLILEGIQDYPDNRLQVFSRNGLIVFDLEGYDNETKAFKGVSNTRLSSETLPEGTYFYSLKFREENKWTTKKGWFVLKVRN